jgi:hypothetical protein
MRGGYREEVFIVAGREFGVRRVGKRMLIVGGLYGLRSSGARFREHLFRVLNDNVDGNHWEYLATYVDDILVFSKDPMAMINKLKAVYTLKGIGEPDYYLGRDIAITLDTKIACSAKTYIKRAVTNYEALFDVPGFRLYNTLTAEDYHPELDELEYLTAREHSIYRYSSVPLHGLLHSNGWISITRSTPLHGLPCHHVNPTLPP